MRNSSLFIPNLFWEPVYSNQEFLDTRSHVEENEHGYFIQIDAPGIKKEDLRISLENQHLVIEGERKGKFAARIKKTFSLPDEVDQANIEAQMNDGVLELALPKKAVAKPKLIPIQEPKEGFFQKLLGKEEIKK
jgi:HSP20 family molecular chaperone IbpA